MLPAFRAFKFWRGDTFAFELSLKTGESTYYNITGMTFIAQIKEKNKTAVAAEFTTTIVNAVNGRFRCTLSPTESAKLQSGKSYTYDVQVNASNTNKFTVLAGPILVQGDTSS